MYASLLLLRIIRLRSLQANLIYLGLLTGRVPIVNVFNPSHVGIAAGSLPFDQVFDLDTLSEKIGLPVVQWHEVKDPESEEVENIGCWNTCKHFHAL